MKLFHRVLNIALVTVELLSNNRDLIYDPMYFEGIRHPLVERGEAWNWECIQANFKVREEKNKSPIDASFYILDRNTREPNILVGQNSDELVAIGNWSSLENSCKDKRYSLLGNQGLLFRYILSLLEKKLNVFNFHACGLYDKSTDTVYLVLGERGSGKKQ